MLNRKESEKVKKAAGLAEEIARLDSDLLSVDVIDEPGHLLGDYIRDGHEGERTPSKEVWQSASFQQALFFSGKHEASTEEVVVIEKNEYQILLRAPEQGIIVIATAVNMSKSIADVLTIVERIRKIINSVLI